ncbi:MAG: (d)CMP kinase [Planctomycetota bacterium]
MANLIVTIDGPAASGKSTVARLLAKKLDASFLDTGAMYRAVTLAAMQAGIDMRDEGQLQSVLQNSKFEFAARQDRTTVRIDGADVTERIRRPDVTAGARYIAAAPNIREKLVQMQRQFAASTEKIITEGRDQGTVAFPDADIKFYLEADLTERARRRQAELCDQAQGNLEQIKRAIEQRDKSDQSRGVGPLRPADDAVVVDATSLSAEEVVQKLITCIEEKCS